MAGAEAEARSVMRIAAVVTFYFVVSIALVFLNKYVLTHSPYRLDAPLLVTWFQLVLALLFVVWLGSFDCGLKVPRFEFRLDIAAQVLPLSLLYVGMLATNNLCLTYVNMAFFQVARSLTMVFNIALTILVLRSPISLKTVLACAVVLIGFVTASRGELEFSWVGTAFGVVASLFNALYSIYVKKILPVVGNNEWSLLGYNTTLAIFLLLPVAALFGEIGTLVFTPHLLEPQLWLAIFATGVAGFLINVAVFLQIKYTSPLTNNISGTAKAALQTVVAVIMFGDTITALNVLGILLVMAGSALYSHVKLQEMRAASAKPAV